MNLLLAATLLVCQMKVNTQLLLEQTVEVGPEAVVVGEVEGYKLKVKKTAKDVFELDVFDYSAASRSYASSTLRYKKDVLSWSLWTREVLVEASCRLK